MRRRGRDQNVNYSVKYRAIYAAYLFAGEIERSTGFTFIS